MTDPTTALGFLTEAVSFITNLGLTPFLVASGVAGLALYAFKKAVSAGRDGGGWGQRFAPV